MAERRPLQVHTARRVCPRATMRRWQGAWFVLDVTAEVIGADVRRSLALQHALLKGGPRG